LARRTGGKITVRAFETGQLVLVRAAVASVHSHSAIVRIPTVKLMTELPVEVPISEIFLPGSSDEAAAAVQLLMQRLDSLCDIGLRVQAEIYELGGHALTPRQIQGPNVRGHRGDCACVFTPSRIG
jgi:hypothetical protein